MSLSNMITNSEGSRMGVIGSSFAHDLARRISQSSGLDSDQNIEAPQGDEALAAEQSEKLTQLRKLESALSGTVEYMSNTHGEKAASATIALVYKRLGNSGIDEQTLGDAFMDVTRFIDKNFGAAKGDEFMAHLNGSLNNSMNVFFDNGLNETFMVAPTSGGSGGGIYPQGMLEEIARRMADTIKTMLEEARANPDMEKGPAAAYTDRKLKEPLIGVMKDMTI